MQKPLLAALCSMLLSSCMTLVLKAPGSDVPVSLSAEIKGYRTGQLVRHIEHEIWVYQVLGLPWLPSWTREGLPSDDLVGPLLKTHTRRGQGLIRLRVRQSRTPFTWLATLLTLGLVSSTAVTIEGDVVELLPAEP